MRATWYVVAVGLAVGCAGRAARVVAPPTPDPADRPIRAMLARSAGDWNRGDLAGFMSDYAHDSLTGYVAGGHVVYGWQRLFDRYRATYFAPGTTRDSLVFEEVRVRPLAPGVALCTARFKLLRRDAVIASGPFTLVLVARGDRWQIVHDHTSSDPRP